MKALTKNCRDLLVKLHEQGELKKLIFSSARARIGGLFEAAYMDNEDFAEWTSVDEDA